VKANAKPAGTEISIVTRQMSPNSAFPAVPPPAFRSLPDFLAAYTTTDKTIVDLTGNFVGAADAAKQKQDEIIPHLAYMQSLLSKKGKNHHLVVKARKKGNKIPWWSTYYAKYKDRLWESLRTMERRIREFRKDPSVETTKREKGVKPKHLTPLEHKLLGTATCVREVIVDLRAGRVGEAIAKLDKNTPTQDRIAEHLERGVKPSHDNPDGNAKLRSDGLEPTPIPSGADDELKAALANELDRDIASKMLTDHLRTVANQFANDRIEIKQVSARIEFAGRSHRIMPGDWLEKQAKDAPPALSKCVGVADFMARRRVQEWGGEGWTKEHVVFSAAESDYRVISEEIARMITPEAFEPPAKSQVGL
jgi:hypothetical protein